MPIRLRVLIGLWCALPLGAFAQSSSAVERLDSLILERTSCLGTCAAYRLAVHSNGLVRFDSRNRNDSSRTESDSGGARALARLAREVVRVRFFDLPPIEVGKAPYCRIIETDAPTISVAIFGATRSRVLSYYTGCMGQGSASGTTRSAIARLERLADSVDAATGASRWIRPAPCCAGPNTALPRR